MTETTSTPTAGPEAWGVTAEEARASLRRQMCPVCGEGPWKSPLLHVAKKHGIDSRSMRETCGITSVEVVADPELSEQCAERARAADATALIAASRRGPRGGYRTTAAGRAAMAANLAGVPRSASRDNLALAMTPEARAKQSATLRAKFAAMTSEERKALLNHAPIASEEQSRRSRLGWERRGLQSCGTIAAYKRGCRCEPCRDAKRASRRS